MASCSLGTVRNLSNPQSRQKAVQRREKRTLTPTSLPEGLACASHAGLTGEPVRARWIEDGKWELRYGPIVLG